MWNPHGGPPFNPMMGPGPPGQGMPMPWQQQQQAFQMQQQQFQQQQVWQQQQQYGFPQQQMFPGMWQQQPPGFQPQQPPQPPGQRPALLAQPPLPGVRPPPPPPSQPPPPGPSSHPPPPPPSQPPPPPAKSTSSIPPLMQPNTSIPPLLPANSTVPPLMTPSSSSTASSKSASVNKLDLSAPPPPPPPEEDKRDSQQGQPARGRGRGDFSNNGHRGRSRGDLNNYSGNRGRESNNFNGNRGRGNRGSFDNGFSRGRGGHPNQKGNSYQGRGGLGGGYNYHYDGDNTEYDDHGYDDMDLENDNEEFQEQSVPDWRGPQSNNINNGEASSSSSSIRPGDWRCKKCEEINFARREKCRRCNCDKNFVPPPVSDKNQGNGGGETLENFDKMFDNWERTYSTWREENRLNPDREYVHSYTEQMEAMRGNLMEKRRKLERSQDMFRSWHSEPGGIPGIDPDTATNAESERSGQETQPPTSDVVNRILDDNDYDDSDDDRKEEKLEPRAKKSRWGENTDHRDSSDQPRVKKSRWEADPEDNLDIDQMRRRPDSGGHQQNFQPRSFSGPPRPVLFPNQGPQMSNRGRGSVFGHNRFPHHRPNFINQQQRQDDDFEQFWKPSEVKDYSRNQNNDGGRFSQERDFRPQTFDYSHGGGRGRGGNGRQVQSRFSPAPVPAAPPKPSGACVMIDSILTGEGRRSRPPKMVIILRGVPGSGKSHLAKLIKDREMEAGGEKVRTMCLDDYFDVDGVYEYEPEMEESYRASFLKSFKKTVDGNLFSFILVDAVHNKVSQFREFWSYAKQNGFEVYVCNVDTDPQLAASRNIHKRTAEEVIKLSKSFEETPGHMNTLDARSLLQDDAIEHVEMSEAAANDDDEKVVEEEDEVRSRRRVFKSLNNNDKASEDPSFLRASKWEILDKEEKLARLDGTGDRLKTRMAAHTSIKEWLELDTDTRDDSPLRHGQKRVRWADIEQRKRQARTAQLGFVVGQRNWATQEDREAEASSALAATKIIPNRFHSEFHN